LWLCKPGLADELQFARFGTVCRTFAPLYRQFTLTALRAAAGGPPPQGERPPAGVGGYQDVVDAWNHYMANDNNGRGVVAGEVQRATGPDLARGLHLIDVDVAMGDLIRIAGKQAAAHTASR
jgi:hypothetical protein